MLLTFKFILRDFSDCNCLKKYLFSTISSSTQIDERKANLMKRGLPKVRPIENVKHIVLIASGKGGVGKSTIAANLATTLKVLNPEKSIGFLDTDIFGPSLPLMMNLNDTPLVDENKRMLPLVNYGVKCMSMGFLIEDGSPVIWRGLMVMQALERLIRGVNWGPTDYLIVDTPPGTGDTHLSLIQNIPIDGVILVTTPQKTACQVTKRGAIMFRKLEIPIIGLVENMSAVTCPKCLTEVKLFGSETDKLSADINTTILERIPLVTDLTESGDSGLPIIIKNLNSDLSRIYKSIANDVISFLNQASAK